MGDDRPTYYGISYWTRAWERMPRWLYRRIWRLWERHLCPNGLHLFDEVTTFEGEHYLGCDACGLMVHIARVEG